MKVHQPVMLNPSQAVPSAEEQSALSDLRNHRHHLKVQATFDRIVKEHPERAHAISNWCMDAADPVLGYRYISVVSDILLPGAPEMTLAEAFRIRQEANQMLGLP